MPENKHTYKRIGGYFAGFALFFAPFALFQRTMMYFLQLPEYNATIHSLCFRVPVEHLLSGKIVDMQPIAFWGTTLLLVVALLFGPLFCGFLCPSGAVGEFLSKVVPARFKVNWGKHLPVAALRYGFLFGFLMAPFTGGLIACAFCNFYVFDLVFNYFLWGYIVSFSSSMLLTIILWIGVLGFFTQGGRGFCTFFCPVGSVQNFIHYLGSFLPFTWQLKINKQSCSKCCKCVKKCPMTALQLNEQKQVDLNRHVCILCMECVTVCPNGSICYSNKLKEDGKND